MLLQCYMHVCWAIYAAYELRANYESITRSLWLPPMHTSSPNMPVFCPPGQVFQSFIITLGVYCTLDQKPQACIYDIPEV